MSITAETKKVLENELERLKKERHEIDQTIQKIEEMIVSGTQKASSHVRRVIAPRADKPQAEKPQADKPARSKKTWEPKGRAKEALQIIQKTPGIGASEIAEQLKLKNSTAIYPALNKLVAEGFVKKSGKAYSASS